MKQYPCTCFRKHIQVRPAGNTGRPPLRNAAAYRRPPDAGCSGFFPEGGATAGCPPCTHGNSGRKMLPGYTEKQTGGIRYRIHSVFGREGDFRLLSESLLESRVLKHYGEGC